MLLLETLARFHAEIEAEYPGYWADEPRRRQEYTGLGPSNRLPKYLLREARRADQKVWDFTRKVFDNARHPKILSVLDQSTEGVISIPECFNKLMDLVATRREQDNVAG
jgi:hypothetical protein